MCFRLASPAASFAFRVLHPKTTTLPPLLVFARILPLLAEQPADSPQNAVLLGVVWMVFAWNLEDGGESSSVGVNPVSYPVCNLLSPSQLLLPKPGLKSSADGTGARTCWLIRTMPMSFLSVVNRSKASSMVALSVLPSTTRKFFCESGGAVTC